MIVRPAVRHSRHFDLSIGVEPNLIEVVHFNRIVAQCDPRPSKYSDFPTILIVSRVHIEFEVGRAGRLEPLSSHTFRIVVEHRPSSGGNVVRRKRITSIGRLGDQICHEVMEQRAVFVVPQ